MQQEETIYSKACRELYSLINKDKVREITATNSDMYGYVTNIKELFFDAILRSSLCSYNGTPYLFTGMVYEKMTLDEFKISIHDLWLKFGLSLKFWEMRKESIIKDCLSRVNTKILHPDNSKVVFENGVFDLDKKMFFHDVDKRTVQLSIMPYKFDHKALCPNWHMFLDSVLPEKKYQEALQEFLGSIFINRRMTKIETMLILFGGGANGKSVIFQTVVGILGADNVTNFGVSSLISGQEKKKNIASINGKRLNYCSELGSRGYIKDTDNLKTLISGEPTEARALYGNNFTAYDIPLFMSNTNKLPKFDDYSNGMRRRIMIIPFEITIPIEKRNANLANELTTEYPGIFNWVVEGRERFIMNDYHFTEIETLNGEYQTKNIKEGGAMMFMLSRFRTKQYGYMPVRSSSTEVEAHWNNLAYLYPQYCLWCGKKDNLKPVSKEVFRDILKENGFEYKRKSNGMCFKVYRVLKKYNRG